jgi:hypothetical protein
MKEATKIKNHIFKKGGVKESFHYIKNNQIIHTYPMNKEISIKKE